jgi:hypothetical protein
MYQNTQRHPNKFAKAVTRMICLLEVAGSNLDRQFFQKMMG